MSGKPELLMNEVYDKIHGDGFKAGLEAAAKHEPKILGDSVIACCACRWDSRSGQSWADHIKSVVK